MIKINGTIPLAITPTFWMLAALIGYLNSQSLPLTLIWMVVIIISVLVHEYGHALTAMAFGQRARIELVSFGGVTHRHGHKLNLWKEFLVVLNGPCLGLLLCAVSLLLVRMIGDSRSLMMYALQVSACIAAGRRPSDEHYIRRNIRR
jgi:stage IV sporulation protein FB